MKLSLGFSPCPNDTFIFDAMVNGKMDCGDLEFEVLLEDVETLNQWAIQGKLDITKLSFPAFFQALNKYILLGSGSALGKGVGPLLVSRENRTYSKDDIERSVVALPGVHTTANLLFSYAWPGAQHKQHMVFSAIEDAVLEGKADLGVIIHENRFTYQDKGLFKVMDLGAFWEEKMSAPIPLGGIAIKRNIEPSIAKMVEGLIKKSIDYSFANYPVIADYVKRHSQAMSEQVMRQHIELYVNDFSKDLGITGREAIQTLFETYKAMNPSVAMPVKLLLFV